MKRSMLAVAGVVAVMLVSGVASAYSVDLAGPPYNMGGTYKAAVADGELSLPSAGGMAVKTTSGVAFTQGAESSIPSGATAAFAFPVSTATQSLSGQVRLHNWNSVPQDEIVYGTTWPCQSLRVGVGSYDVDANTATGPQFRIVSDGTGRLCLFVANENYLYNYIYGKNGAQWETFGDLLIDFDLSWASNVDGVGGTMQLDLALADASGDGYWSPVHNACYPSWGEEPLSSVSYSTTFDTDFSGDENLPVYLGLTECLNDHWVEVRVNSLVANPIPEPVTLAGLVLGVGSLVGYVRRRRTV